MTIIIMIIVIVITEIIRLLGRDQTVNIGYRAAFAIVEFACTPLARASFDLVFNGEFRYQQHVIVIMIMIIVVRRSPGCLIHCSDVCLFFVHSLACVGDGARGIMSSVDLCV